MEPGLSVEQLGMCLHPAMGAEVHGDAAGQQDQRDSERADNPGQFDSPFQHEVIEDTEDQDENRRFGKERGATP